MKRISSIILALLAALCLSGCGRSNVGLGVYHCVAAEANGVRFDPENKPGVSNLMNIYASVTGKSFAEIEAEFDGLGYGAFKPAVGEAVAEMLRPIREEAARMIADKAYLRDVYTEGAKKATVVASRTLRKVYKKVGLVEKPF